MDSSPKTIDTFALLGYTNLKTEKGGMPMMIQRKEYLNKLIAFKDKQLIKVVTGIRRCGKLRPLMAIRDHYPKMILTLDDDPEAQYDGIRRINARDWLLGLTDN